MKRLGLIALAILVSSIAASAQIGPSNITISGSGATVQISATSVLVRSFQLIAPSGNSATVEVGDATTTSSTGLPIAVGAGQYFGPLTTDTREAPSQHFYDLSKWYVYVANGDKVQVVATK